MNAKKSLFEGETMMYIVSFERNRHSAWNNLKDAQYQVKVLKDNGYTGISIDAFDATMNYENGHYFV
jgi:hypothetical protein